MAKHQLKSPCRQSGTSPRQKETITFPQVLSREATRHSATLEGKVGVYWEAGTTRFR